MGTPYLSEIRLISFNYAPKGWAFCNGQTLPINQNQALFSLLGTTYGGNGTTTFQLPNLQGRVAMHFGSDPFGNSYVLGETGGAAAVTLTAAELPAHTHAAQGVATVASLGPAAGNVWANSPANPYGTSPNALMNARGVSSAGASQPHQNESPYLVLNYVIALQGIFPSRN
jgi:microcystin-dependent protein